MRSLLVLGFALGAACALGACGQSVATPASVTPPQSAFSEVPYPPPAALVEVVPPSPKSGAVWLDGRWTWRGTYYTWLRGGWVFPPEGAAYARWQYTYSPDGRILFAEAAWYRDGQRVRSPEIQVPASTPPNEVTPEFQITR